MRMYVKAGNIRMNVEEWNLCVSTIGIFFPSLRCPSSRLRIVAIRKVRVAAFWNTVSFRTYRGCIFLPWCNLFPALVAIIWFSVLALHYLRKWLAQLPSLSLTFNLFNCPLCFWLSIHITIALSVPDIISISSYCNINCKIKRQIHLSLYSE